MTHDDPNKTVTDEIENIIKRIEELSSKQRRVKIRQGDYHSTVSSSVVIQVCGEISSAPVANNQTPIKKRFVQTVVLAPVPGAKQKYYVYNDTFIRYQDNPSSTTDNNNTKISSITKDELFDHNSDNIMILSFL